MKQLVEKIFEENMENFIMSQRRSNVTKASVGTIKHLLFGPQMSQQSILIKLGRWAEKVFSSVIEATDGYEMLPTGVLELSAGGKKKDIDLAFRSLNEKVIYYKEMKANIELDTEKLPATVEKMRTITEHLEKKYPGYTIETSLFNWSVYSREDYEHESKYKSKIRYLEGAGVTLFCPEDFFSLLGVDYDAQSYFSLMRSFGDRIKREVLR